MVEFILAGGAATGFTGRGVSREHQQSSAA
jgi:hypothetical protein